MESQIEGYQCVRVKIVQLFVKTYVEGSTRAVKMEVSGLFIINTGCKEGVPFYYLTYHLKPCEER